MTIIKIGIAMGLAFGASFLVLNLLKDTSLMQSSCGGVVVALVTFFLAFAVLNKIFLTEEEQESMESPDSHTGYDDMFDGE